MNKLKQKISEAIKPKNIKKIENKIRFCLNKAQEHYETNYERGLRYLNIAQSSYERLNKNNDELKGIIDSVGYAYANKGEPIK